MKLWDRFKEWYRDRELSRQQDLLVMKDIRTGHVKPVSETEGGKLFRTIAKGYCPTCGRPGFWSGPHGGISQNIICKNVACNAAFNITPMIGTAEPIGTRPEYNQEL